MKLLRRRSRSQSATHARIFWRRRSIRSPLEQVDLGALQHKSAAFAAINPL